MARVNAPLLAFNRGEVSKLALARVDAEKLRLAAACQVNWLPLVLGSMSLRPGLQHVGEVLNDAPCYLVDFVFSKFDTALLELTDSVMRVWVNDSLVTRPSVATAVSDPTFTGAGGWSTAGTTGGCTASFGGALALICRPIGGLAQVTQTLNVAVGDRGKEHGIRIVVASGPVTVRAGTTMGTDDYIATTALDTGTHCLTCTPTTNINLQIESTSTNIRAVTSVNIDAAGTLTVPTPWTASDLANVRYAQSGDVIFVAAYGKQQYKIERRSTHGWSVAKYWSNDGPFQSVASIEAQMVPGDFDGTTSLTCSRAFFRPDHVGALFRLFSNGQHYGTVLGAANAFSPAVRVSGVGATRNFTVTVSGTWSGTLSLQRSFDGPDSGFVTVQQGVGPFTENTGGSGGSPDLDNVIAWYRIGFLPGGYTNGAATAVFNYDGGGGYGICRVIAYNSPTQVTIDTLQQFSSLSATLDWVESDWSPRVGWPDSVALHEGRLGWFGRDKAWLSASDDYTSYAEITSQGDSRGDSGPIIVQFGAGPVDTVSWGLPLTRLLLGCEQAIKSVRSSSFDEVLTPTNVSIKDCSTHGAARLPAIKVDTEGIMVDQSGRRLYQLAFNPQRMDYTAHDLTRLNLDIGKPGFVDIAVARQPDTEILLPRTEGQCAVLLYDPEDEVEAFWRMQTLGVIENARTLPSNAIEDIKYFVVRRVINGVTRRFIEKMALRDDCLGGAANRQLDCHFVYQGAPVSTVPVAWLPNTLVAVWADGAYLGTATTDGTGNCAMPDGQSHSSIVVGLSDAIVIGSTETRLPDGSAPAQAFGSASNTLIVGAAYEGYPCEVFADLGGHGKPVHVGALTVSGGAIALPDNKVATTIVACLGYCAPFLSAKLAYGAQMGSPLTRRKKIDHVGLVLFDTAAQGLQFGQRFDMLDALPQMECDTTVSSTTVWSEYDEPPIEVAGEWNTDSRLALLARAPNPCTVGGVVVSVLTHE